MVVGGGGLVMNSSAKRRGFDRGYKEAAVRLVVEDGLPYRAASWHLWRDHRVFVPFATIQNWVEAGGEKGGATNHRRVSGRRAG